MGAAVRLTSCNTGGIRWFPSTFSHLQPKWLQAEPLNNRHKSIWDMMIWYDMIWLILGKPTTASDSSDQKSAKMPFSTGQWVETCGNIDASSAFRRCRSSVPAAFRRKLAVCDVCEIWLWINTYENTIFRGMNIHLPAILMWTTGVQGFDPLPYLFQRIWTCLQSPTISYFLFYFVSLLQPQQIELTECIAKSWLRKWEKSCWRLKLHSSPQASLCTQSMTSLTYNHIYIFYHICEF